MDCNPPAPLFMGFSRQEYWSGLLCPPAEDLSHPGIEPMFLTSPALAGGFFTLSSPKVKYFRFCRLYDLYLHYSTLSLQ